MEDDEVAPPAPNLSERFPSFHADHNDRPGGLPAFQVQTVTTSVLCVRKGPARPSRESAGWVHDLTSPARLTQVPNRCLRIAVSFPQLSGPRSQSPRN
jgi:hypothetical protein